MKRFLIPMIALLHALPCTSAAQDHTGPLYKHSFAAEDCFVSKVMRRPKEGTLILVELDCKSFYVIKQYKADKKDWPNKSWDHVIVGLRAHCDAEEITAPFVDARGFRDFNCALVPEMTGQTASAEPRTQE